MELVNRIADALYPKRYRLLLAALVLFTPVPLLFEFRGSGPLDVVSTIEWLIAQALMGAGSISLGLFVLAFRHPGARLFGLPVSCKKRPGGAMALFYDAFTVLGGVAMIISSFLAGVAFVVRAVTGTS